MKALLDTNFLVVLRADGEDVPDHADLTETFVSSLGWAEPTMGLHRSRSIEQYRSRARRLSQLQAAFGEGLPRSDECIDSYDQVLERVSDRRGDVRARRFDRLIAATAIAHQLPLVTRNTSNFQQFEGLLEILTR